MATKEEIAWLAGVLEGEACFDLNRGDPRYPRMRIEMTDRDVLVRIKQILGNLETKEGGIRARKTKKIHHTPTHAFQIAAIDQVKQLFAAILPWMSARRSKQIVKLMKEAGWVLVES